MSDEKMYKGSGFCGPVQFTVVNYQETKLRIMNGLPKLKDVPKDMVALVSA